MTKSRSLKLPGRAVRFYKPSVAMDEDDRNETGVQDDREDDQSEDNSHDRHDNNNNNELRFASDVPVSVSTTLTEDLKHVMLELCNRVSVLEKMIEQQSSLIANLMRPRAEEKVETGVQACMPIPSQIDDRSFADVVRQPPVASKSPSPKQTPTENRPIAAEKLKTTTKRMTEVERVDVTEAKTNDVKSAMTRTGMRKPNTEDAACLPRVAILHDSVLNHVYARRLGLSYGCQVSKIRCSTIKEVKDAAKKVQSDVGTIVVHVGTNDIKTTDPTASSRHLTTVVRQLLDERPDINIVINKLPPSKNSSMQIKRELFNAHIQADLSSIKRVSFITNENVHSHALRDDIHPNRQGSAILASNIGRHLHRHLWQKQRRPARPREQASEYGYWDWAGRFHPY